MKLHLSVIALILPLTACVPGRITTLSLPNFTKTVASGDSWKESDLDPATLPSLQVNVVSPSARSMALADLIGQSEAWIVSPTPIDATTAAHVGASLTYTADGWPTSLPAGDWITFPELYNYAEETLGSVATSTNSYKYVRGVYVVTWKGQATVSVHPVPNITDTTKFETLKTESNRIVLQVKSSDTYVGLEVSNINSADPIHGVRLWTPIDEGAGLDLTSSSNLAAGAISASTEPAPGAQEPIWHPKYLEFLRNHPAKVMRFMDWNRINGITETDPLEWKDTAPLFSIAPRLSVITSDYQRIKPSGAAWRFGYSADYAINLANAVNKDVWFNIPHTASDDFIRKLADSFSGLNGGTQLKPGLRVWLEFSNEIWNTASAYLPQNTMAKNVAADHFGVSASSIGNFSDMHAWGSGHIQGHALKVFEDEWKRLGHSDDSLVNVITGWPMNTTFDTQIVQAAREIDPRLPEVFAVNSYFGDDAGNDIYNGYPFGANPGVWPASLYESAATTVRRVLVNRAAAWKATADTLQTLHLPMIAYEGGQSVLAIGHGDWTTASGRDFMRFLESFQDSQQMGDLYRFSYALWRASGGLMNAEFTDIGAYSFWGYWGAKRYLLQDDATSPKTMAVKAWGTLNPDTIRPMTVPIHSAPHLSVTSYKGEVGIPYSTNVIATGGDGTVSISVLGGYLPPGLSLTPTVSGTAVLSGTPTEAGTFPAVFRARDSDNDVHDVSVNFVIDPEGTSTNAIMTFQGSDLPNSNPGGNIYNSGRYDWMAPTSSSQTSNGQTINRLYLPFSTTSPLFQSQESGGTFTLAPNGPFQMYGGISLSYGPSTSFVSNGVVSLMSGSFYTWVGDSVTKTTLDFFAFWKKSQFINGASSRTVTFGALDKQSTLHMDIAAVSDNQNELHFVVQDGSTWYMSEAAFNRNYLGDGIFELTGFNNSNVVGKRWTVVTPTADSYTIPASPTYAAHDFTDVQAVGVIGSVARNQWNFLFQFVRFFALGN